MRGIVIVLAAAALGMAPPKPAPAPAASSVRFTEVTAAAGLRFTHNSGRDGRKLLPETLGSGAAFLDFDGDGWLDLFLVNSRDWKSKGRKSLPALYRNQGDGSFADATRGSGLDVQLYGLGVAVGDYDNDGRPDLYLTALEGDRLYHNEGKGKFKDATAAAGIRNASFGTSAAFLDYDRDGKADLFVANYVQWSEAKDLWCSLDGATKSYCTPESYKGTAS
ncbi:MAG TPA: VCBS repeat-containing protein, partial [Thermoanaerobaculia bacterium]|nr:VCBS repeat-containing protein [Thermoanaerobaculia bacterium]